MHERQNVSLDYDPEARFNKGELLALIVLVLGALIVYPFFVFARYSVEMFSLLTNSQKDSN